MLFFRIPFFAACSSAFQALIYDKMPSLIPDENKLKMTAVPADKYPLIRKNKEVWKLELDKLSSKEIKNCDICSGHDGLPEHGLGGPLFQKACEGLILARVIEKARKTLEGSLEGDYLSEFNDINLVDELKMKYLGMDDTSDWGLLEALSTKDAVYTEPMTSDILNLSSSSKIIKKVVVSKLVSSDVSDVEPGVEMEGMVETKDATGGGDADHEKVVTDKVASKRKRKKKHKTASEANDLSLMFTEKANDQLPPSSNDHQPEPSVELEMQMPPALQDAGCSASAFQELYFSFALVLTVRKSAGCYN